MMKRRWLSALAAMVVMTGPVGAASAHPGEHSRAERVRTVTSFPVSWTLTDASCSRVPPGTTISGTGVLTSVHTIRTGPHGVITETFDDDAEGTATDQNGETYQWSYANRLTERNSATEPDVYQGLMTDRFHLRGDGPIRLSNGFVATIIDDRVAGSFEINPLSSYGDPFNFPLGPNRCDPL